MIRIYKSMGLALLALVALTSPVAAEEQGSDWLGAVGNFVRAGLGPARTIEDIRRDEERAREAAANAVESKPKRESAQAVKQAAPPPPIAESEPVAVPVVVAPAPIVATPVPVVVAPAPVPAVKARNAVPPSEPKPQVKPAAIPQPEPRPKPAVAVAARVPTPPPEPLSSRIAATATLDQAMKLGGSAETYGQRIRKPVRN